MAIKTIRRIVTLDGSPQTDILPGALFTGEKSAHVFVIICRQGAQALALTGGAVRGEFINELGQTVELAGSVVAGAAVLPLSDDCYAVRGRFGLTIFHDADGASSALYHAEGKVTLSETDSAIDPGTIIPSVSALIAAIHAAVESIPEDYSTLSDMVDALTHVDLTESGYIGGTGAEVANSDYRRTGYIPVASDSVLILDGFYVGITSGSAYAYYFYTADQTPISGANGITSRTVVTTIPSTAAYVRFSSRTSQGETPVAYVSNHVVETLANLVPRMDDAEADVADLKSAISPDITINLSAEIIRRGIITTSSKWNTNYSDMQSYFIPVNGAKNTIVTGNAANGSIIAFLKTTIITQGATPDFCVGTGRIFINANTQQSFVIPNDCTSIYLTKTAHDSKDYTPYSMVLQGQVDLVNRTEFLNTYQDILSANIWDYWQISENTTVTSTGGVENNGNYDAIGYFPVTPGTIIYGFGARFACYDSTKTFVSGATGIFNNLDTVLPDNMHYYVIPDGASYFRICAQKEQPTDQFQLYKASSIEQFLMSGSKHRKLYCIGDSITKGTYANIGSGSSDGVTMQGYPYWIGQINGYNIVNLGESGAGYANKGTDTTSNGKDIVDNNTFTDADIITIALGVNDWKGGDQSITLGSMSSTSGDGTVIGNMKYMIETLADPTNGKAKQAQIIILLPMNQNRVFSGMDSSQITLANNWSFGYAFRNSQTLEDYRDAIRECAEYYNVKVVDLEEVCPINRLNIRQVVGDGLHPTKEFYKQMGEALAPLVH